MHEGARQSGEAGFTLTELLVVLAIIVLLTTIIVPNVVGIRVKAALSTTEANIENLKTALEAYRQAFGQYPGDVFPSEDLDNDGVLDPGEDIGVNIDPSNPDDGGTTEYGAANGRLDAGDGVVNILDLEWALRTKARGGPFLDDFPKDGWNQPFVYTAPMVRGALNNGVADALGLNDPIVSEDTNGNGLLDPGEDIGIALYTAAYTDSIPNPIRAGQDNGVLDWGDDDNGDGLVTYADNTGPPDSAVAPNIRVTSQWELGNVDISPDGYARNRGYYLSSVGIDGVDDSHSGYEDITGDNVLTTDLAALAAAQDPSGTVRNNITINANSEDIDTAPVSTDLDTGYEDTGLDGRPNTKDLGENDGALTTGAGNTTEDFDGDGQLDIGNDDINSWNENKPWRNHASYN